VIGVLTFVSALNLRAANSLHELLKERVNSLKAVDQDDILVSGTPSYEGFIPVQSIEYGFVFNDQYSGSKSGNRQTEKYSLRFNIKSLKEISSYNESVKTSEKLALLGKTENENLRLYNCYLGLVRQIFMTKQSNLLADRNRDLEKSVNQKADMLGLSKMKSQDLLDDLILLQKLDSNLISSKAQIEAYGKVDDKLAEVAAKKLSDAIMNQYKKISTYINSNQKLTIVVERKQLEARLERINKEVGWADDEKLLSHIEVNHDPFQREDSYRVAFNIPWIRFDNENRNREKVLLFTKESSLARDVLNTESELKTKLVELETLAGQIESVKPKFDRLRLIEGQVKGIKDIAMLTSVSRFKNELELELLRNSVDFYNLYLELLRDTGTFAKFSNSDLLDPSWGSL
jgi:hypothetical protein